MSGTEKFQKTATNLLPPSGEKTKNLFLRGKSYYFRQMVDGKQVWKSLGTGDYHLARYLMNQIIPDKLNRVGLNTDLAPSPKLIEIKHVTNEHLKKVPARKIEKNRIIEIWNSLPHGYKAERSRRTAELRLQRLIGFLGCDCIEDLSADPNLIDAMKTKLFDYRQGRGGNKGHPLSKQTISDSIMALKQVVNEAEEMEWITNANILRKKLSMKKIKCEMVKKRREPLAEEHLKTLFETMNKIKRGDFGFLGKARGTLIKRIKSYPKAFYYTILLSLFTGSRSCAVTSLCGRDFDKQKHIVSIRQNKELVKKGDTREHYKQLKTKESERDLCRHAGYKYRGRTNSRLRYD